MMNHGIQNPACPGDKNKRQTREVRSQIFVRAVVFCFLFSVFCFLFSVLCYAGTTSPAIPSVELINNAKQHDGQEVVYEGEVIGDVMARGEYCWVNVNDGQNAIGIWVDKDLAKNINYTGSYRNRGDVVKVTGIFHRACIEHGGDLDIHANSLRKIIIGEHFVEKLNVRKRNFAIALLIVLCVIWILTFLKRK